MKRIIRLTESDLARIVRRVISENNRNLLREGVGATAYSDIKSKDRKRIANAVYSIKNNNDYNECLNLVKKNDNKNTILSLICKDWSLIKDTNWRQAVGMGDEEGGKLLYDFQRHLGQDVFFDEQAKRNNEVIPGWCKKGETTY